MSLEEFQDHCILLAPYFHTGVIETLAEPSSCAATMPLHGPYADDNISFNKLCAGRKTTTMCVHTCAIKHGRITGRIVVPGAMLLVLYERGVAPSLDNDLVAHLVRHNNSTHEWTRQLFTRADSMRKCAAEQHRWLRPGPDASTRLLFKASALGRFASHYLLPCGQAIELDPSGQGMWLLLTRGADARLLGFWDDEYRRLVATVDAAARIDPSSRDTLTTILGTADYAREYAPNAVVPIVASGAQATPHPACAVCTDAVANIVCMPCAHACMCAKCAQRTFSYDASQCYPTGHPVPSPGSQCPICRYDVHFLFRIHQL